MASGFALSLPFFDNRTVLRLPWPIFAHDRSWTLPACVVAPVWISPDSIGSIVPPCSSSFSSFTQTENVFIDFWFLLVLWFLWFFWFLCRHQSGGWLCKGKGKPAASALLLSCLTGSWASGRRPAATRPVKKSLKKACSILVYANEYSYLQTWKIKDNPFLLDFRMISLRKSNVLTDL